MKKTKKQIVSWLMEQNIQAFELVRNKENGYIVNVFQDVNLMRKSIRTFPIQFGIVKGNFNCSFNNLFCLVGAPKEVHGHFNCNNNELTSLIGCPQTVHGNFICSSNWLETLEHGPEIVMKNYDCSSNELISLKHSPHEIHKDFNCAKNYLKTLEGCPEFISGVMMCSKNQLENLLYFPKSVKGDIFVLDNKKLENIQSKIDFDIFYQEHKRQLIIYHKNNLSQMINENVMQANNSFKIIKI